MSPASTATRSPTTFAWWSPTPGSIWKTTFATYVRNSADSDNIIYVGPMGCRTGFYFITRDCVSKARAIELVQETCEFIKTFEGEIPGSTRIECGNYLDHSLPKAKDYARQLAQTLEGWTEEKMVYEQ